MYLIDTNVISEFARPKPAPKVLAWLHGKRADAQFLSVLSIGEIRHGIEKMPVGPARETLGNWLEGAVFIRFQSRILPVTIEVVEKWARLRCACRRTLPAVESLIAATALHHDLRLVTRNVRDFAGIAGLDIVNPWEGHG